MSPTTLVGVMVAGWLVAGGAIGVALHRQGHPLATAAAAVIAWPAMVSVLSGPSAASGPYEAAITAAFAALRTTLLDPANLGAADVTSLDPIEASLRAADQRIGGVDRLLADPAVAAAPAAERLRVARVMAGEEVEAVLQQLVVVRVQLGLTSLRGDTQTVRSHLLTLAARARALEEVDV